MFQSGGHIGFATTNPLSALTITKNADVHGTQTTPNNGTILIQDNPNPNSGFKLFIDANEIQSTNNGNPE